MNGRSSNNSRGQIGPGAGIPALRIEAETPQPNERVQLPALPTQRSIISQGKATQNGYTDSKSPFVAPRAPGPNGIYNGHHRIKGKAVECVQPFGIHQV